MMHWLILSSALLWVIALCNLLLTLALVRRQVGQNRGADGIGGLESGQSAPDFTAQTLHGVTVTRADYLGRAVAFLFVGPNCSVCRTLLPSLVALAPKAARAGVEFVLVSTGDTPQTQALVDEFAIPLPVLVAPPDRNPFMRDYHLRGTPAYCMLEADGRVKSSGSPKRVGGDWKAFAEAWEAGVTIAPPIAAEGRHAMT